MWCNNGVRNCSLRTLYVGVCLNLSSFLYFVDKFVGKT